LSGRLFPGHPRLNIDEAAQALDMVGIQLKDTKQIIAEIQFYLEHSTFEHS